MQTQTHAVQGDRKGHTFYTVYLISIAITVRPSSQLRSVHIRLYNVHVYNLLLHSAYIYIYADRCRDSTATHHTTLYHMMSILCVCVCVSLCYTQNTPAPAHIQMSAVHYCLRTVLF